MAEKVNAIGLDIGTSSICAVVIDGKTGKLLEAITRPNNANMKTDHAWEKQQNPRLILDLVEEMVMELETSYVPLSSIGMSGQMHGIVYVDERGAVVSPLYTWQDGRGNLAYKDGLSYADFLSKTSGYKLATGFGAVTHFYNQVNRLVPPSAKYLCTIQDYAAMRLARAPRPTLHASNAASLGFFQMENASFDRQALAAAGIDPGFFPDETAESALIGMTASKIPVSIAIGDNQASFIGAVNRSQESLLVNIGTSGQISVFVNRAPRSPRVDIRPLTKDGFLLVGSSLCGGRSYALLEKFFRSVVQITTGTDPGELYEMMNQLAGDFRPGEDKLEISTQFSGTRDHPGQRAAIRNLGVDNFTPRHFIAGVLEGMVRELYDLYEIMGPELTHKPQTLIGSGNAIRLCRPLQRVASDVFAMPINIPLYKEEAGYGAALFALAATGHFKTLAEAQSLVQYEMDNHL